MTEPESPAALAADAALQQALVAEAALAPNVHNAQPTRWRFTDDGRVVLFRALDRSLPEADPSGHDVRLSLGASWEGLAIALSTRGLTLGSPQPSIASAVGCVPVAEGRVSSEATAPDALAPWVVARRCYRGRFDPTPRAVMERLTSLNAADIRITSPGSALGLYATLGDRATHHFMSRPAYQEELYRWLRLSPSHPDWGRDGINADCLALSAPERWVASVALRPAVFRRLDRFGVGRLLVSEAAQIRSAAALILFIPERTTDDFTVGRRFYRLWLECTEVGLGLAPMSALADWPESAAQLCDMHGVPPDRRLANVFRAGTLPASGAPRSPRLPVHEVLV